MQGSRDLTVPCWALGVGHAHVSCPSSQGSQIPPAPQGREPTLLGPRTGSCSELPGPLAWVLGGGCSVPSVTSALRTRRLLLRFLGEADAGPGAVLGEAAQDQERVTAPGYFPWSHWRAAVTRPSGAGRLRLGQPGNLGGERRGSGIPRVPPGPLPGLLTPRSLSHACWCHLKPRGAPREGEVGVGIHSLSHRIIGVGKDF